MCVEAYDFDEDDNIPSRAKLLRTLQLLIELEQCITRKLFEALVLDRSAPNVKLLLALLAKCQAATWAYAAPLFE